MKKRSIKVEVEMIKMNTEIAGDIQIEFELLLIDDFFPTHFAPLGRQPNTWQFAVELIYRLLICELATLKPIGFDTKEKIEEFCKELALHNPCDGGEAWYYGEISLTERGIDLAKKYMPKAFESGDDSPFELNVSFIDALEKIFEDYNVGWDEEHPFFPVTNNP